MKKKASKAVERRQHLQRQAALESIRKVARLAVTPALTCEAASMLVWTDRAVNVDALIDRLAVKEPDARMDAIQGLLDQTVERLEGKAFQEGGSVIRALYDRCYRRCLLASDVGFELGFAAATSLLRGGRS